MYKNNLVITSLSKIMKEIVDNYKRLEMPLVISMTLICNTFYVRKNKDLLHKLCNIV